jgi:flagellar hook-associated protein 3 FlgL
MTFRVTDSNKSASLLAQIGRQQQRLVTAQEHISTGKRINRPSDDPAGAGAVIRIRSSQSELEQFKRNATAVNDKLNVTDSLLEEYDGQLERTRAFLSQGVSDTTPQEARNVLATQLDSLRQRVLHVANSNSIGEYVFGGTRQNAPPFDPTTEAPAAPVASPQYVQIEPNAQPIAAGVTAESVFTDASGTIFEALTDAAAALRGTGDPVADRATLQQVMDRLSGFVSQTAQAQGRVGAGQQAAQAALENLQRDNLSLETSAQNIEGADFAEAAIHLTEAERALEATLQTSARFGRRSLLDFLG